MPSSRVRFVNGERDLVNQQPGNSWKYLYERLSEKQFQPLCGALPAHVFPNVTCYPVGQADGGRDAVQKLSSDDLVYQVKWSSKRIQDPAAWLTAALQHEHDNIVRLAAQGATGYYLLTNIAGTSGPGHGSMDRLDRALLAHSKTYGIPMSCWWQADLDARVDAAPTEITWKYPQILAGVEALRYVMGSDSLADTVAGLPLDMVSALLASSSRIGLTDLRRPLPPDLMMATAPHSKATALLIAHHLLDPTEFASPDQDLDVVAGLAELGDIGAGPALWPANHAASGRMLTAPSAAHLAALSNLDYRSDVAIDPVTPIAPEHWATIVANPATYPRPWVLAADTQLSRQNPEPALGPVADQRNWFTE